jgi:hypothetical protein
MSGTGLVARFHHSTPRAVVQDTGRRKNEQEVTHRKGDLFGGNMLLLNIGFFFPTTALVDLRLW